MSDDRISAYQLAARICEKNDLDFSRSRLAETVRNLRYCGLSDDTINDILPGLAEIKEEVDRKEKDLTTPDSDEILVHDLPDNFKRQDWR